jgi:hypothetical protein
MKKFILRLIFISSLLIIIIFIRVRFLSNEILNGNFFSVNKHVNTLFLGNSHPECAINDTILSNAYNIAHSSENYIYSYLKAKKMIESNPSIKNLFIEFGNLNITDLNETFIWGDEYINWRFPRFSPFMTFEEYSFFLKHNAPKVLKVVNTLIKEDEEFLKSNVNNYIYYRSIGGHKKLEYNYIDSLLKHREHIEFKVKLVDKNFDYLNKLIKLCENKHINFFLIRCPIHPNFAGNRNEKVFQQIRNKYLKNIPFLDFKHFPLKNSEFGDFGHLNYFGAKRFSLFLKDLFSKNLVHSKNPQQLIDDEMKKINLDSIPDLKFVTKK